VALIVSFYEERGWKGEGRVKEGEYVMASEKIIKFK
jgi:hypothetical protein